MARVENRLCKQTVTFTSRPRIHCSYTIVGPSEGNGPHALELQEILQDDMLHQKTPEQAERLMLEMAIEKALAAGQLKADDLHFFVAGDLLNQIITSTFAARSCGVPFLGVYGACSTFLEAMGLAGVLLQGGFATRVLVATASHYQTAERQFRYPLELNVQHTETNQHTVTGAAAAVISHEGDGPSLTHATFGTVVDWGMKNVFDMGSAMAPAAFNTIKQHLEDTGRNLEDYDLILTGDLGRQGSKMLRILLQKENYTGLDRLEDGGAQIYSQRQKIGAGGSGTACVAVMTLGYLLNKLKTGRIRRALVIATGALLSTVSAAQGESIPCIAHAISLEG